MGGTYHDNDRSKLFSRRALILGGGKATLIGVLAARMYYLQVMEADKYAVLAEDNRISTRLLAPPRGLILDRNGIAMAVNQQNYRVMLVAERSPSLDYTLDALSRIRPAMPMVWPSCTTILVRTVRSEKVGELMPVLAVLIVLSMSLTSCPISSVTMPSAPICGTTSRITPVWR